MTSKFARNFCLLIFLATITINSFGVEPTKRFGCHNFSSVNKIADMNNNTNELFRNLERCMRDTNTYNKENLGTAKKFQNDFELAQKDTWSDIFYRDVQGVSILLVTTGLIVTEVSLMEPNIQKLPIIGITWLGGTIALLDNADKHAFNSLRQKRERKEAIAPHIKNFVDMLQKKK